MLLKDVAVETVLGRLTKPHAEHTVVANAQIEHTPLLIGRCHLLVLYRLLQWTVEIKAHLVGPSVLVIGGRALAVGDAVADDGEGTYVVAQHLQGGNVEPFLVAEGSGKVGLGRRHSFEDVAGSA